MTHQQKITVNRSLLEIEYALIRARNRYSENSDCYKSIKQSLELARAKAKELEITR